MMLSAGSSRQSYGRHPQAPSVQEYRLALTHSFARLHTETNINRFPGNLSCLFLFLVVGIVMVLADVAAIGIAVVAVDALVGILVCVWCC